jgi:hypothetical protein
LLLAGLLVLRLALLVLRLGVVWRHGLRISWLASLGICWRGLLLIGWWRWWRLTDDRSLCEGRCRKGAEKYSVKDARVEFIHVLFLWIREEGISSY